VGECALNKFASIMTGVIFLSPLAIFAEVRNFNYGEQKLTIDLNVPNFVKEKQTFLVPVSVDSDKPQSDKKSEKIKVNIEDISNCDTPISIEPSAITLELDGAPVPVRFSAPDSPCNHTINFTLEQKNSKPQTIYRVDISVNNYFGSHQVEVTKTQPNVGLANQPPAKWTADQ
jgi:hypothetical protein